MNHLHFLVSTIANDNSSCFFRHIIQIVIELIMRRRIVDEPKHMQLSEIRKYIKLDIAAN